MGSITYLCFENVTQGCKNILKIACRFQELWLRPKENGIARIARPIWLAGRAENEAQVFLKLSYKIT